MAAMDEVPVREVTENMESFNIQGVLPRSLLCRFQQVPRVHDILREQLFSPEAMLTIAGYLNDHGITATDPQTPRVHVTMQNITSVNIRFATFAVQFPADGAACRVMLLDTVALPGFYNLNLRRLVDRGSLAENGTMIDAFIRKILMEHRTDRRGRYIVSLDVYYNRLSSEAGKWHRDSHPGEMTENASLEFFVPEGVCFLGPEVVPLRQVPGEALGRPIPNQHIADHLQALRQRGDAHLASSLRYIGTDGTVFMFDNVEAIHATPITPGAEYDMFPERSQTRAFINVPDRVVPAFMNVPERVIPGIETNLEDLSIATRDMRRSFIRSWMRPIDVMPPNGREIPVQNIFFSRPHFAHEYDSTAGSISDALRNAVGGSRLVNFIIQTPFLVKMNDGGDIPKQHLDNYIKNEAAQLKNFIQALRKQKKSDIKGGRKRTRRKRGKRKTR